MNRQPLFLRLVALMLVSCMIAETAPASSLSNFTAGNTLPSTAVFTREAFSSRAQWMVDLPQMFRRYRFGIRTRLTGIPAGSPAAVFANLWNAAHNNRTLTLKELARRLKTAPSTLQNDIRLLHLYLGLIRPVQKGYRTYYELVLELIPNRLREVRRLLAELQSNHTVRPPLVAVRETRRQMDNYLGRSGEGRKRVLADMRESLKLAPEQIQRMVKKFQTAMGEGLAGKPSSIEMLPAYIGDPTGREAGKAYALDLGGTNFRILALNLGKGVWEEVKVRKFTLQPDEISDRVKAKEFSRYVSQIHSRIPSHSSWRAGEFGLHVWLPD